MSENTEFNMDKRVIVKNLAPWNVGFPNKASTGDTVFSPSGSTRMRREEIVAQAESGNKLFNGINEIGSHATLFIDDAETREYLGYDSKEEGREQEIINDDKITSWFNLKTQRIFEKKIEENVVTMAEKSFLLEAIKRLKFDSFEKISFCQEYCKFRLF